MTTMTFEFNYEKLQEDGKTADDILKPMREHAKKFGIQETEYGVFSKSGSDAMCIMTSFAVEYSMNNPKFITYLDKWELDVDGEVEDVIEESKKHLRLERRRRWGWDW